MIHILHEIALWFSLATIIAGAAYLHPVAGLGVASLLGAWIAHICHSREQQ